MKKLHTFAPQSRDIRLSQLDISSNFIPNTKIPTLAKIQLHKWVFFLFLLSTFSVGASRTIQPHLHLNDLLSEEDQEQTTSQCMIGFSQIHSLQSPQILITDNKIQEQPYGQFVHSPEMKFWLYCKFLTESQQHPGTQEYKYLTEWQQCLEKCCSSSNNFSCYFQDSLSHTRLPQQQPYVRLRILQSSLNSQQPQLNSDSQSKPQFQSVKQQQKPRRQTSISNSADTSSSNTGIQVLVIVLACLFGIPFILLLFFSIVSVVRMCRNSSEQPINTFGIVQNRTPQILPFQPVNLSDYNIDNVGPFMINPKEQCSICLDESVNVRTYCGHHYHAKCIKSWLSKVRNKCPVCMGQHPNPMKVYCKRCNVGIRLAVVNEVTLENEMNEISELICAACLQDREEEFSRSFSKKGESGRSKRAVQRNRRKRLSSEGKFPGQNKAEQERQRAQKRFYWGAQDKQKRQNKQHKEIQKNDYPNNQQIEGNQLNSIRQSHNAMINEALRESDTSQT